MTRQERRGKWLFLVVATLIVLEKLTEVGFALSDGLPEGNWLKSLVQPLAIAGGVALVWYGDTLVRWLAAFACLLSGAALAFASGHVLVKLAVATPPEGAGFFMRVAGLPLGLFALVGLFYVGAGLLLLLSPSMKAFFRYQREGWQTWGEEA